jgi:hypothetical protein
MSMGWREIGKRIGRAVVCSVVLLVLLGCSQSPLTSRLDEVSKSLVAQRPELEEVSAPVVFGQLGRSPKRHDPQVKIVGIKPDATLEQKTASIRFEVEDFSIFKDPDLGLGPHLQVLLDDQPYTEVYDAQQSITFTDLKPGTHTVRAFASYPWHESFKASSAFDQITFNVFAPTQANRPDLNQPLLTYSQPQGDYGAEPIMVDYLITPPLSLSKTQGLIPPSASVPKSKVQITVNGQSFITEESPPIYLKGFKSGVNWVKVALLSANGKAVPNALSEAIQLVTFNPGGKDTVSQLVRGELDIQDAEQIISLETSQRRAAQKLEALSTPKIVPIPTAVEPKLTNKETDKETEIFIQKSEDLLVKPTPNLSPAKITEPAALKTEAPEKMSSKATSGTDAPLQSFLKRFRQPEGALPSPSPKATAPVLELRETDKAEKNGDSPAPNVRPIPLKTPAASPMPTPAA